MLEVRKPDDNFTIILNKAETFLTLDHNYFSSIAKTITILLLRCIHYYYLLIILIKLTIPNICINIFV